ncbi:Guanine nucleotide-binding protein G(O) subunit alpha, variant 3 [Balamuthia mandrillaris]
MEGGSSSHFPEELSEKELKQRSRLIDKQLQSEARSKKDEQTILMLGPAQSGKSTFCKQMKILHLFGFTENEKENFKWIVHTNTLDAILDLIQGAQELGITLDGDNQEVATDLYEQYRVNKDVEPETIEVDNVMTPVFAIDQALGKVIKTLWEDPGIRQTYNQRSQLKFHLGDSVAYYLDEVERTSDPKYVPDEIDILRARVKTTSVVETTFEWEGAAFRLVDVGGQKGERKKWLPLFSGVTAILFCVAMNEYDVMMEEDPTTNRMHDALQLWHDVVNNHHLINVPIILFLNKKDLFESKIQKKDLKVCFPNYKGTVCHPVTVYLSMFSNHASSSLHRRKGL